MIDGGMDGWIDRAIEIDREIDRDKKDPILRTCCPVLHLPLPYTNSWDECRHILLKPGGSIGYGRGWNGWGQVSRNSAELTIHI